MRTTILLMPLFNIKIARFNVLRFSHMATKRMTIVHTFNILIVLMNTEAAKCDYMSKLAQLID